MKTTLHYRPSELSDYINWLYFFHAWGFPSRYGALADACPCPSCRQGWLSSLPEAEQAKGAEAVKLFADARAMLDSSEASFSAHALVGLYEANADGDDILVRTSPSHTVRLPMLRQQSGDTCLCLSDFLLPLEGGAKDRIALFVTSVDAAFVTSHNDDPYRLMLAQTLADRLAEAAAERVHQEVRTRLWAYAPGESLTPRELFEGKYQGIRPAVGYPSLPDQSLNFLLDSLLAMSSIGVSLTESGAMLPHASVSGLMLASPKATLFAVGRIGADQAQDYSLRRGLPLERTKQFLASNLL